MRPHGRARISRSKPEAQAVCDRCGFRYSLSTLSWQFDWEGARLQNLRILVCNSCLDKPQENIRTIILPPDPMPRWNPRPEWFVQDDNPLGGLGWDPANQFSLSGPLADSGTFGNLTGGGGPDAVFFGGPTKFFRQSATFSPSSTAGQYVGINWSALPGAPQVVIPSTFGAVPFAGTQQSYTIYQAQVWAPADTSFVGSTVSTTIELDGSNDGATWLPIGTATSLGVPGENVTITANSSVVNALYAYHRIVVYGDGVHPAAIASATLYAAGPSGAQTGSELGA